MNLQKKIKFRIASFNLLGLTRTERHALKILILLRYEFKNSFSDKDLTNLQLSSTLFKDLSWKKKVIVDFYEKEFTSVWQVISYLTEKGYLKKDLNTTFFVTTAGKIKVNELESIFFTLSKLISIIGVIGGILYFISQCIELFTSKKPSTP